MAEPIQQPAAPTPAPTLAEAASSYTNANTAIEGLNVRLEKARAELKEIEDQLAAATKSRDTAAGYLRTAK